jgi:hypothetical protein
MKRSFNITRFEARTLSWWKTRRNKIDMEPSYQRRGRLWSDTDKAYLIDSILNGFDVPKIYMADFTWGDSKLNAKKLPYAIIDGKQRFEAIFDFYDGKVALNDDFVYSTDPSIKLAGLGYKDLVSAHPDVAEEFDNYNLDVMSVAAQTVDPINELFVRLNRSKALTGAEIRNAMAGPAPEVIREIAKHEVFETNVRFVVKRGEDLNAAAKVLLFEYNGKPVETKKTNLDVFVRDVQQKDERGKKLELSARRAIDVLNGMSEIFLPKDKLLSSSGVFPVYYWFIRGLNSSKYHRVRSFLLDFEATRAENRRLIAEEPHSRKIDSELVTYDKFNRSTNDQASHVGRVDILQKRFRKY